MIKSAGFEEIEETSEADDDNCAIGRVVSLRRFNEPVSGGLRLVVLEEDPTWWGLLIMG
jgi:hypothetical protein